jgi:hypothetical protein
MTTTALTLPHFNEEEFRKALHHNASAELSAFLKTDSRLIDEIGVLVAAFLRPESAQSGKLLRGLQERGRRRKQALPRAANALLKAAARYRELEGLELIDPGLAERNEKEALRLLQRLHEWDALHYEKRFGVPENWLCLLILEDFVTFWVTLNSGTYRLSLADLTVIVSAGKQALYLGKANCATVKDDLRGLAHFRSNPRNQLISGLAANYAYLRASRLSDRPFLIRRNEI